MQKVFYHGTGNAEFEKFDESKIGCAHDMGWYGYGFYFCFTAGEASYYGPYVRAAELDIKNPFFFHESLMQYGKEKTSVIGDFAAFAINLSEQFPKLAEKLSVTAIIQFNDVGPDSVRELSFPEYAKIVLDVYHDKEFSIFECIDGDKTFFAYKHHEDYNCLHFRFETKEQAIESRLDMAAAYVNMRMYSHVSIHIPEYYMEDISKAFTDELKSRGYDGIFQSKDGDEVVCFSPDQVHWVSV